MLQHITTVVIGIFAIIGLLLSLCIGDSILTDKLSKRRRKKEQQAKNLKLAEQRVNQYNCKAKGCDRPRMGPSGFCFRHMPMLRLNASLRCPICRNTALCIGKGTCQDCIFYKISIEKKRQEELPKAICKFSNALVDPVQCAQCNICSVQKRFQRTQCPFIGKSVLCDMKCRSCNIHMDHIKVLRLMVRQGETPRIGHFRLCKYKQSLIICDERCFSCDWSRKTQQGIK